RPGYGMCAAALLSSVPSCPLGVPDSLKKFAFKAAKTFILAPQPPVSPLADEIATVRSRSHPSSASLLSSFLLFSLFFSLGLSGRESGNESSTERERRDSERERERERD